MSQHHHTNMRHNTCLKTHPIFTRAERDFLPRAQERKWVGHAMFNKWQLDTPYFATNEATCTQACAQTRCRLGACQHVCWRFDCKSSAFVTSASAVVAYPCNKTHILLGGMCPAPLDLKETRDRGAIKTNPDEHAVHGILNVSRREDQ